MRFTFPLVAVLSAAVAVACSTPSSEADDVAAASPHDQVYVAASTSTREAHGVSSWGIRTEGRSTLVSGYDAQNEAVVKFAYRAGQGPATTFDVNVQIGGRRPKLQLEAVRSTDVRVVEGSLSKDNEARAMLRHMAADLRAGKPRSATLEKSSVRPLDLVGGEQTAELATDTCPLVLSAATANAGDTAAECSGNSASPACQQGVDQAPREQDDGKDCPTKKCMVDSLIRNGGPAVRRGPITGEGTSSAASGVRGTDLGIPFSLGGGAVGFLFGDTFDTPTPVNSTGWRSPVMLRSDGNPSAGINFAGTGYAGQIMDNAKQTNCEGEYTVIPNDGVTLPDGRTVISFMSVRNWAGICPQQYPGQWRTNYAGLAVSAAGGAGFVRAPIRFPNDEANSDPYQMQTMQLDGEYVYVYSVRAGRQTGPMMLQRVRSAAITERGAYECWGYNGSEWAWGNACTSILGDAPFGEPSVRKLGDCLWVMSYLDGQSIVTRTATAPEGPWSPVHLQVTGNEQPCLYGGFIHPNSTADELHIMVSQWGTGGACGGDARYAVDHFVGKP